MIFYTGGGWKFKNNNKIHSRSISTLYIKSDSKFTQLTAIWSMWSGTEFYTDGTTISSPNKAKTVGLFKCALSDTEA